MIGGLEVVVILAIAAILFGPKALPGIGRSLGGTLRALRGMEREVMSAGLSLRSFHDEPPLLVFVSSSMTELAPLRKRVQKELDGIPLTTPWLAECSPASADPLETSYLEKVDSCDLFVLILGDRLSERVRQEYERAREAGKPCLVFVRAGTRNPEVEEFVNRLTVRFVEYEDEEDLGRHVFEAVIIQIIRSFRRYGLTKTQALSLAILLAPASWGEASEVLRSEGLLSVDQLYSKLRAGETIDLATGNDFFAMRERARELLFAGEHERAETIYLYLVSRGFQLASTHCHLARVALMRDLDDEAAVETENAWRQRQAAADYVVPRILFLRLLLSMLGGHEDRTIMDEIRRALGRPLSRQSWVIQPVIEHLRGRLSVDQFEVLSAVAAELSGGATLDDLAGW